MCGRTCRYMCYPCLRPAVMALYPYSTIGLTSTITTDHQACILQLYLTSSHVSISCILSACMSVTVSASQHPCMLHLNLTICHVCNNFIWPLAIIFKVSPNQQSYLFLHIQACMSVELATDQYSSNGCYNCTGLSGLYQPAVKMVTNICSMQIHVPYWQGLFLYWYTALHKYIFFSFYTPPHFSVGVLCYTFRCLSVCPSVRVCVLTISIDNFSIYSRNFFKFCIHIVIGNEWYGIVNGQNPSIF